MIYWHIGYHRTGTTFFRKSLVPCLEGMINSEPRLRLVQDPITRKALIEKSTSAETAVPLIICNESISGNLTSDDLAGAKFLAEISRQGKVLISIRSQYSIFPSLYHQYVKEFGVLPKARFVDSCIERKKCSYFELVSEYVRVFGKQNVYLMFYEELMSEPNTYLHGLSKFLGVGDRTFRTVDSTLKTNPRAGTGAIEVRRLLTRVLSLINPRFARTVLRHKWTQQVIGGVEKVTKFESQPIRLRFGKAESAMRDGIHNAYSDGNRKLGDLMNCLDKLKRFGYPL